MLSLFIGLLIAQKNPQYLDLSALTPPPQIKVTCSDLNIEIKKQTAQFIDMNVEVNGTKISIQRTKSPWQALSQTFKTETNQTSKENKEFVYEFKNFQDLLNADKVPLMQDIQFSYYDSEDKKNVFSVTLRVAQTKDKHIFNVRELIENKSLKFRSLLKMKYNSKLGHYISLNIRDNKGGKRTCKTDLI